MTLSARYLTKALLPFLLSFFIIQNGFSQKHTVSIKGRLNIDGEWFQFGRKQGIISAQKEKIMAPEISFGGNFTYDINGVIL